jgi:hypothetical protein
MIRVRPTLDGGRILLGDYTFLHLDGADDVLMQVLDPKVPTISRNRKQCGGDKRARLLNCRERLLTDGAILGAGIFYPRIV